jgi:hypothetical protein
MNTLKTVFSKLFKEETKLASHEVELFKVEDTIKLYNQGLEDLKNADIERAKVAQLYSKALIKLQMNVPAQLDDSIKKLIDLGIMDKANELKQLKSNSEKKAAEYTKIYNALK